MPEPAIGRPQYATRAPNRSKATHPMSDRAIPNRADYRLFKPIATRWSDNDVYAHVNNVVHYSWFDTAVNGHLLDRGLLEIEGSGPIFVVAETGCRYFGNVGFPTPVEVGIAVATLGRSSVVYDLAVFPAGEDAAVSRGRFVHVCVDRVGRRPVEIPAETRAVLASLLRPAET